MINSKADYKYFVNEDLRQNNFKIKGIKALLGNDIRRFLKSLRFYEYILNTKKGIIFSPIRVIAYYRFKKLSKKLGYSIPPNVCDSGLMLPHYGNIVINRKCKIGKNCKIHIGVNIGGGHDGTGKTPQIGNNCYIAPGAKIFGGIILGDRTQIGANAVVNKSFLDEGNVLVGIPAKSIKKLS
jgi:serine O-acetyltransferase